VIEQTLVIIKPHAVGTGKISAIEARIREAGFAEVMSTGLIAKDETIRRHYHDIAERYGPEVLEQLVTQMTAGILLVTIYERECAVSVMRELIGATDPAKAAPGTIRGDFCNGETLAKAKEEGRAVNNLIHASSSPEEFEREKAVWFC
jgi:nucleoside-diphosphate kinase